MSVNKEKRIKIYKDEKATNVPESFCFSEYIIYKMITNFQDNLMYS
jgi:hypothetical protein